MNIPVETEDNEELDRSTINSAFANQVEEAGKTYVWETGSSGAEGLKAFIAWLRGEGLDDDV